MVIARSRVSATLIGPVAVESLNVIGETLSQYRITAKLGKGGMGEVFEAEDTELHRKVALKVLPEDLASDPERLERFKREARAVASLNHPNIVTLHTVEEADGRHFLTMELVDGKSLDDLIPEEGFDLERLFELVIPIADALAAAHEVEVDLPQLLVFPARDSLESARRASELDLIQLANDPVLVVTI